jgi:hypothetical protein
VTSVLSQSRGAALLLLALFWALASWSLVTERQSFLAFAVLAHASLCFFIATEAFGPVARQRSLFSRWMARVLLVPSLAVAVGSCAYLLVTLAA